MEASEGGGERPAAAEDRPTWRAGEGEQARVRASVLETRRRRGDEEEDCKDGKEARFRMQSAPPELARGTAPRRGSLSTLYRSFRSSFDASSLAR